jgi:hypothetical protein
LKKHFGKQIIEAPRRGSGDGNVKARWFGKIIWTEDGWDYEGLTRIPASPKGAKLMFHDSKDFSDKLSIIHRYLRSSCGRLWDDVWSELSQALKVGGRGVQHIREAHINVARNTYRGIDGKVYVCDTYGISRIGGFRHEFYVEPETGILRQADPFQKYKNPKPPEERRLCPKISPTCPICYGT